jgi:hypothetical protein
MYAGPLLILHNFITVLLVDDQHIM